MILFITMVSLLSELWVVGIPALTEEFISPQEPTEGVRERSVWDDLADCESGEWDANGIPIEGSADWSYDGRDFGIFEGGLNFHPDTWDWLRPEHFPDSAADATREQEIYVAELVLSHQGWRAWPTCSKMIGLR